jgi:hypothetical protein
MSRWLWCFFSAHMRREAVFLRGPSSMSAVISVRHQPGYGSELANSEVSRRAIHWLFQYPTWAHTYCSLQDLQSASPAHARQTKTSISECRERHIGRLARGSRGEFPSKADSGGNLHGGRRQSTLTVAHSGSRWGPAGTGPVAGWRGPTRVPAVASRRASPAPSPAHAAACVATPGIPLADQPRLRRPREVRAF